MPAAAPIDVARRVNHTWATRPFKLTRETLLASRDWDDAVRRFEQAGLSTDPIDPNVEVMVDAFPEAGSWIGQHGGRDAWIRFWQVWVEPWSEFELADSNYEQIGDHVLVEVHVSARPRGGGEPVEIPAVQVFKVRDGLIRMYAVYPNRDDALAAIRAD